MENHSFDYPRHLLPIPVCEAARAAAARHATHSPEELSSLLCAACEKVSPDYVISLSGRCVSPLRRLLRPFIDRCSM